MTHRGIEHKSNLVRYLYYFSAVMILGSGSVLAYYLLAPNHTTIANAATTTHTQTTATPIVSYMPIPGPTIKATDIEQEIEQLPGTRSTVTTRTTAKATVKATITATPTPIPTVTVLPIPTVTVTPTPTVTVTKLGPSNPDRTVTATATETVTAPSSGQGGNQSSSVPSSS